MSRCLGKGEVGVWGVGGGGGRPQGLGIGQDGGGFLGMGGGVHSWPLENADSELGWGWKGTGGGGYDGGGAIGRPVVGAGPSGFR